VFFLFKALEQEPEFRRQRVADIMTIPVQRLAGVKLLLEKLQKKSIGGQSTEIRKAIEKVGGVLSQANTVRLNSDKYIATLNLLAQVDAIPVAKKIRTLGKNTFVGKAVWKNVLNMYKKPYKCVMTLKAEQIRGMTFIYCKRKAKAKGMSSLELERTPICCWKVREERGDVDWFIEVDNMEMELFAACLFDVLSNRIGYFGSRCLKMDGKLTFDEVPLECQAILKKELHEKNYSTEDQEEETKVSRFSSFVAHTLRWGNGRGTVNEVIATRTMVVRSSKQQPGQPELQGSPNISARVGKRKSIATRPRLIYPIEEAA
ncbi:Protein ECT2, partial [Trichostrongylus colubriformis]